jgi:hypothetical protein
MASNHKDNKYGVIPRLNDHDAQLLEIRALIKSTLLVAGPQGSQGQTGASGADGRNGNDGRDGKDGAPSTIPGPPGRAGHSIQGPKGDRGATPRFKVGEVQTIDVDQPARVWLTGSDDVIVLNFAIPRGASIKGDTGDIGETGERGDCLIPNDSEVAAALLALRQKHARFLAMLQEEMAANGKRQHNGLKKVLEGVLKTIESSLQ